MAYPRVFISSTCYDLREIRDVLFSFIDDVNYIPVLSDKGDVFYHPDIHTHDSCLNEIETCQLFILIIGGRFGGKYKADASKSIVNAEYECAKRLEIPIITFISREVYDDHRVYVRNRIDNPDTFNNIIYPSIEKQDYAINIFQFIDDVRKSEFNNAVFPFEFGREIIKCLKQQWSGMFYEFLRARKNSKEIEKTNRLISDLTLISEKTEEILNKVYSTVDENAAVEIAKIDIIYEGKRFLLELAKQFEYFPELTNDLNKFYDFDISISFQDFLLLTGEFNMIDDSITYNTHTQKFKSIIYKNNIGNGYLMISGDLTEPDKNLLKRIQKSFDSYCKLSVNERKTIFTSIM